MGLPVNVSTATGRVPITSIRTAANQQSVEEWLKVALSRAGELKRLHTLGVLHRDLHPGNVLWSIENEVASLIDFDFATPVRQVQSSVDRSQLVGSLAYMVPETTGRMDIGVDERVICVLWV